MDKKRVLILGTSAPQYDAVEALKSMEIHSCVVGREEGVACSIADGFLLCDILDVGKIIKFVSKNNYEAIYSVGSELAIIVASSISEELGLPYFVTKDTALSCSNKGEMRRALGQKFPANVNNIVLKDKDCEKLLPFPFIMKPADSQGQRGIRLIRSLQEFDREYDAIINYSRSKEIIIEEYVDGNEFSFNGYIINYRIIFGIISDRITWENRGLGLVRKHIMPSIAITKEQEESVFKIIESAIKALKIPNGPVYCQFKLKDKDIKILEITPRWDGCHLWRLILYLTGINFLIRTFEHLLLNKIADDLSNIKRNNETLELTFFCEDPGVIFNRANYKVPNDAIYSFFYYKDGNLIRPINGIYEKVGYYIRQLN